MKSNDLGQRVKDIAKQIVIETTRVGLYLTIISIPLITPAILYEKYFRSTEEGKEFLQALEKRSGELDKNPNLSKYDKQAIIFSEFYGLR